RSARGVDRQVGHLRVEVADVLDVELVDGVGGERGDRDRHVLQGLLALARVYLDRLQRGGGGARRGRGDGVLREGAGRGEAQGDGQAQGAGARVALHRWYPSQGCSADGRRAAWGRG